MARSGLYYPGYQIRHEIMKLLELIIESRQPSLAWSRWLVSIGWFSVALSLLLLIADTLDFQWSSSYGIRGWIEANQYPKQRELFYWIATILGVPATMVVGWTVWWSVGYFFVRIFNLPPVFALRQIAILHFFLLSPWLALSRLQPEAWRILLGALGFGMIPLMTGLIVWNQWVGKSVGGSAALMIGAAEIGVHEIFP